MKARFTISKDFKHYAKLRGFTVKSMAEALNYKEPQVSQIMNGEIEPSMRFLHRLCSLTKLGVSEIVETKFI